MDCIKKEYLGAYQSWADRIVGVKTAKLVSTVGKGFREVQTDLFDENYWASLNKDSWVLVCDDFDFTATRAHYLHGVTNIVMLSTDVSENQTVPKYFFDINYPNIKHWFVGDALPWKAVLKLTTQTVQKLGKKGQPVKGISTEYVINGDTEYMSKTFDSIIANFPYSLGNEMTKFIIDNVQYKDGSFIEVLPFSKLKKSTLTQYVIPGTIKNNTVKRQTSAFDGADTYPIIFRVSKTKTNTLSFDAFEKKYNVNRDLGKKFFEEQDRRIAAEESGARPKAFVEQACMLRACDFARFNSKTAISQSIWTPHIAHGWGAQALYEKDHTIKDSDYYQWNFIKVDKPINEVFNVAANNNIAQTETVMNTEAGKDHMLCWMHSAELSGKYRHCGLFTILLRWMNKSTCCKYDYILPRVDWDSRDWTDEEILKDYGYTDEEIEEILHYNDDLIPESWKKQNEGKQA